MGYVFSNRLFLEIMKAETNSKSAIETLKEKIQAMPEGKDFLKQLSTLVSEQSLEYDYLCQIQRFARLSESEISKMLESLTKSESESKRIRKKLTEAHLAHVVWLAKDYYHEEIPFWDIINEGTLALVDAVQKFDPEIDSDFSDFIMVRAQRGIAQFVKEETSLKELPNTLIEKISSIKHVVRALTEKLGTEPTREQIAKELKITEEELERLIALAKAKEEVEGAQAEQGQQVEEVQPQMGYDGLEIHPDFIEPEYYEGSFEGDDDEE